MNDGLEATPDMRRRIGDHYSIPGVRIARKAA